jgi:hypothetical protein
MSTAKNKRNMLQPINVNLTYFVWFNGITDLFLFVPKPFLWVHPPILSEVRVTQSLILCVCFVDSLFDLLYFFFWHLCCLFFELWILITPFGIFKLFILVCKIIYPCNDLFLCVTRSVCTTWLRLFLHERNKNFDQSLNS